MSIFRSLAVFVSCAAMSLPAASAQAATAPPRHASSHAAEQPHDAKHTACEKVWAAQKVRHGTRQAFVAACVAKG